MSLEPPTQIGQTSLWSEKIMSLPNDIRKPTGVSTLVSFLPDRFPSQNLITVYLHCLDNQQDNDTIRAPDLDILYQPPTLTYTTHRRAAGREQGIYHTTYESTADLSYP